MERMAVQNNTMNTVSIKRKILIVNLDIPYPLYIGGIVRIYNLIKRISEIYEVSLICTPDRKTIKNAEFLRQFCKNIYIVPIVTDRNLIHKILLFLKPQEWPRLLKRFMMLLQGVPFDVLRSYHFAFRDKLKEVLKRDNYDIIQFESLETAQYLLDLNDLTKNTRPIMVVHAILTLQTKRQLRYAKWADKIYYALEYVLMKDYEKKLIKKFDHIITVTELEKQRLVEFGIHVDKITVTKTGTDIEKFRPAETPELKKHHIVHLGSLEFLPNKQGLCWFLDKIFPVVSDKVKDATLIVIGKKNASIVKKYSNNQVVFRGIVENLDTEMGEGMIFIVPVNIGSGIRTKIVTAMAFGMPVVTTSVGIEGIKAGENEGVIIADTEKDFAGAVIGLLNDDEKRYRLGRNARNFVEREYSWDIITEELLQFYSSILKE